jgi:hypothetical protein
MVMRTRLAALALVAAVLAAGISNAAMARYRCIPGYTYRHGVCQPVRYQGYANPVSGAVSGEAAETEFHQRRLKCSTPELALQQTLAGYLRQTDQRHCYRWAHFFLQNLRPRVQHNQERN